MRAIASLALASFASQAMVRAADTLLPQIASDFAVSVGAASIVITVYALTHGTVQFVNAGGLVMGLAFLTLAVEPVWYFAPLARLGVGLGFYMLHNTLQTEATQVAPQARGTALALFASIGQTVGVALAAPVMDNFGARPLFAISAAVLPALALWFTRQLRKRKS